MGSPGTGEEDETSLAGLAGGLCNLLGIGLLKKCLVVVSIIGGGPSLTAFRG